MGLLDQLAGALGQYANADPSRPPATVESDFDQVARAAPEHLAEGVSHAFRSDQTPSFGQMASQLFRQANPQQKTGLLSALLSAVGPGVAGQLAGQPGGLSNVVGAFQNGTLSSSHAEQVSPEKVGELADHAEKQNPSVIDQVSQFVSQHPTLVKSLGAAALTVAMSRMAGVRR